MNQKHKNDPRNRGLQTILFGMLQQEDEEKAKRALITLCDLHQRKVWFDDRTTNVICMACFHASSRIMIASFHPYLVNKETHHSTSLQCLSTQTSKLVNFFDTHFYERLPIV